MDVNLDEQDVRRLFPGLVSFDIVPGVDDAALIRYRRFYLKIYSGAGVYRVEGYPNWGRQQLFMDEVPLQDMRKYASNISERDPLGGHKWLLNKHNHH